MARTVHPRFVGRRGDRRSELSFLPSAAVRSDPPPPRCPPPPAVSSTPCAPCLRRPQERCRLPARRGPPDHLRRPAPPEQRGRSIHRRMSIELRHGQRRRRAHARVAPGGTPRGATRAGLCVSPSSSWSLEAPPVGPKTNGRPSPTIWRRHPTANTFPKDFTPPEPGTRRAEEGSTARFATWENGSPRPEPRHPHALHGSRGPRRPVQEPPRARPRVAHRGARGRAPLLRRSAPRLDRPHPDPPGRVPRRCRRPPPRRRRPRSRSSSSRSSSPSTTTSASPGPST